MKHSFAIGVILGGMIVAVPALAARVPGDPAAGKDKAALCAGCHGDTGNSQSADFPRLAGQYEEYIVKQVRDFQSGKRANNDTMAGMAATVAEVQDAKDIAAYFSQQKMVKEPLAAPNAKLVAAGEKVFTEGNPQSGLYACINCHGERGKGKAKNVGQFPVIGGQHRDYILKNLKDFREGRRSNDPGNMMSDIAKKLDPKELDAVAEYLSAQLP
ncbi:MAG: cytochrome c4 [Gammaproteobacteria bacterium]|nr:cytochrome c4 [Gammaproteobacteria bacterium]